MLEQHLLVPQSLDIKWETRLDVYWLTTFIDPDKLLLDLTVVRLVGVLERPDVVEDIFYFLDILSLVNPKILLRVVETSCFYFLYSLHRVFSILTPLQFLFEEI